MLSNTAKEPVYYLVFMSLYLKLRIMVKLAARKLKHIYIYKET